MGTPPMVSPIRMLPLLLVALAIRSAVCNESGPVIVEEPDNRVDFSNSTGANIHCSVRGHPKPSVVWVRAEDGTAIGDVPGLRRVLANGTLMFPPFRAKDYRQEVHAQVYRCQASNPHGSVHSRDVHVRAVVPQTYQVEADNEHVIRGNSAIIKCEIPSFVADFVGVQAWVDSEGQTYYPNSHNPNYDGKYLVLPSGELHIRSVSSEDGFKSYKCRTVHRLTQETRLSATAGRLVISEPVGLSGPKFPGEDVSRTKVKAAGSSFSLQCQAQAHPIPSFRWFKFNENGRKASVELGERIKQVGGTLIIREAKVEDSGKYLCVVNNSVGGESVETVLTVTAPLSAQVEPKVQTVEFGRPATFTCTYRGNPVKSVSWLKDGTPIEHKEAVLHINSVGREDKGMYQCFVRNDQESAQATAELKLGGRFEPPQLTYTFETSTLQPGSSVYLNCVAAGNPTPEITWELDGTRLSNSERMQVGQYVTVNGEVVSHLNISGVLTNDGGQYACVASSTVGSVKHAARLNVYGLPNIRPMDKVAVVAGENMIVHCPVAGYPIDSIVWEKNGRMLPINRRQHPHDNGTLLIEAVERSSDQGRYTCVARNSQGYTARGDLDVQVMERPHLIQLDFGESDFNEGDFVQVSCILQKGDHPVNFTWVFNGIVLQSGDGIHMDFIGKSSILTIDPVRGVHQGNYTCIASNPAGEEQISATLVVNVPPEIVPFKFPENAGRDGAFAQVVCVVAAGDAPLNISWHYNGVSDLPMGTNTQLIGDRTSILTIPSVSWLHSGDYDCLAQNGAGKVSFAAELSVQVPPRWIVEPTDKAFDLGSDARLECKADSFPRPSLGWKKAAGTTPGDYRDLVVSNPNVKVTDDGTLQIINIQKSHEGYYLCEANNGIGAGLSTVIYVRVQAPPQFKIQYRNQTASRGEDAVLECEAEGETPIGILWSKSKHSIDQAKEPRYTIREEMRGGSVHSSLHIKTTDRSDSAVYTCVATNAFGSADTNINLIIQERPEQPSSLKVLDKSGRSVELSWTRPYDGNSPITRYIVEYKLSRRNWETDGERMMVPGEQSMAAVLDLRPATTYHLRIVARNEIGDSEPSDTVTIITAEEAPSGPPRDLKVTAVDQTSLRVTWKPPLREEWNGDIQGYQVGYRLASSNNSYVFETVEFSKEMGKEHHLVISKLNVYTEYAVVVSAFNKIGQGPKTEEFLAYTAEGTPQQPPQDVTCTTLTSQTIRVSWSSPPLETVQGVIKGYKVFYGPSDVWYDEESKDIKITPSTETHLHGLQKYTNYSLQVLAHTSGGEGVRSQPIHCQTDQDIPEAPTSVKALVMSADSILVSWLPPERPNGIITQYTVYYKEHGKSDSEATLQKLLPSQLSYEASGLKRRDAYVFWVTASTTVGEGEMSDLVHLKLSNKVPAKIASFDEEYLATYKEDVKLLCQVVGLPTPDIRWTVHGEPFTPNDRMRLLPEGSLLIRQVSRDDAGEYTCHVENPYGQDTITHKLLIQAPPHPPEITLQSTTTNSIEVKLKPSVIDDTTPIHGYTIYYKPEFSNEESVQVPASTRTYTLESLWCGSQYQIYASAYNKIGTGESSEVLNTRTKGKKPEVPEVHRFVEVSSSSITLHLNAWQDGGCPMNYFVVEYKPRHQTEWIMASNQVKPTGNYAIMELTPATWYNLRISAHNNAGSSVAEYECATLTVTGATLPPSVPDSHVSWLPDWWPKWLDLNVLVPVIATIVVIIVGIVVVCVAVTRRKNGIENLRLREEVYQQYQYNASMPPPSTMDKRHPGFREELGYIPPPNRKLPPVPNSQYNTCDRIKRGGGSGRREHATWDPRRPMYEELSLHPPPGRRIPPGGPLPPHNSQDTLRSGGDDEICPYATFHLLGFREEMDPQQAGNNFQTFPYQNGHGSQQNFVNSPASRSMPRHGSGNYYSCVSGDYNCGHAPNEGHQPRHGSGNYYSCVAGEYGSGGPPSSTYYSTVPGDMTTSRMSNNSAFSPTYDDPARSDEESDQYGGSTYSGGGPYARAIDSVSQSGTAKRLMNRGSTSGSAGQGSPEPPPPPPPRNGDLPLDSSGLGSSLNDSNNSTASNQFSEAECDHDLVQRNYGEKHNVQANPVKATKSTEEMRKLLDKNEAAAHIQNGGLRMVSNEMNV
ncbi:Down syndrome cell adhesion molecule-like protein Dscam2 isoform X16 [Portunus trituberculatus]|uniref:Down syndrome cell adhesion molecule-like protein Dscam2 isoform X16 n=1 Tax=Portunus trituberculatus TaxID=210409 RepID=UPI001E1CDB5F|nr:Down syndrome cell adhesion molecule-like protein Dscam2 isoform X16 [Portunus trituberculatus]